MTHAHDDLITTAARSLVAREPARPLRARVLERIDRPAPRHGKGWIKLGLPVGAGVALFTAVAVSRLPGIDALPAIGPAPALAEARPAFALSPPLPDSGPSPRSHGRAAAASADGTDVTIVESAAEVAWRAAAVPPLAEPADLVIAVSQPAAVAIALLDVPALTAPRVVVPPIDTDAWRRER